jgi:hypothetical protein
VADWREIRRIGDEYMAALVYPPSVETLLRWGRDRYPMAAEFRLERREGDRAFVLLARFPFVLPIKGV